MLLGGTVLKMSGKSGDDARPKQRVHNCSRIVSPQSIHSDSHDGEGSLVLRLGPMPRTDPDGTLGLMTTLHPLGTGHRCTAGPITTCAQP